MKNASRWVPPGPRPYVVAIIALGAAFCIRYALHGVLQENGSFVFFTVAAVVATAYGGIWPGMFVVIAGTLLAVYFFVPPFGAWGPIETRDVGHPERSASRTPLAVRRAGSARP